jgi:uncharacterized membrane protein YjfL (UPF0719 family)
MAAKGLDEMVGQDGIKLGIDEQDVAAGAEVVAAAVAVAFVVAAAAAAAAAAP